MAAGQVIAWTAPAPLIVIGTVVGALWGLGAGIHAIATNPKGNPPWSLPLGVFMYAIAGFWVGFFAPC
jgi:hypothetical protein